ncbi:unnamed protein product [Penicillium salamii]|uniref:Arginase n=1 Tax=Penicillium salamii TaxID=1612424 RepID=A0A9W4K0Q7_9EURO|nr:unnamed protein product [Penicillium salamii]CAG8048945.1 unnamed protein product [Penicillium salamii]CAG8112397.1 unnamed protein product [Penicillium salamii]CAG8145364.1 unnamed protein product [Penicillium salamii]CAG8172413.1 unnamed protein product [Penicillium salamii]
MAHLASVRHKLLAESHLAVIAANVSCGAPRDGAHKGPRAIIDSGIFADIQSKLGLRTTIEDVLKSPLEPVKNTDLAVEGMKRARDVSESTRLVSEHVYRHAQQGRFVLTLGGDHSIGIGTLTGMSKAIRERDPSGELAVLWIDAHADINTPQTSESGRIHGMPVAFASGLAQPSSEGFFGWIEECHLIDLRRFVYIGLRDIDEAEQVTIAKRGIKAFTMNDVRQLGIKKVMDLALGHIGAKNPIHVSFDIDSLDPTYASSTGFPVASGLSLEEGMHISERLSDSGNLVSMDLVEINPYIATSELETTINSGKMVIQKALGL